MLQNWMATMKSRSGLGVRKALPESKLQKAGDYARQSSYFRDAELECGKMNSHPPRSGGSFRTRAPQFRPCVLSSFYPKRRLRRILNNL